MVFFLAHRNKFNAEIQFQELISLTDFVSAAYVVGFANCLQ